MAPNKNTCMKALSAHILEPFIVVPKPGTVLNVIREDTEVS